MPRGPDAWALGLALAAAFAALALIRGDRAAAITLATVGRLFTTGFVFARYAALGVLRKLSGARDVAPELVRRAFEDLGPTYLKLGQLVASSHGLFPERFCKEFEKTLDRVRPFAYAEVERTLAVELRARAERRFAKIDPVPLASASIAQVHAAELPDGRQVVVKIQRPNIGRRVAADMRILRIGAQLLSLVPTMELANPVGIIDDFDRTLNEELDFLREAANMDEFNRIMAELGHAATGEAGIRAPRVEHALTTRRVITMERFFGVRVDDVQAIRARNVDGEAKLVYGLRCWFQCMILYGFFHGDVHAGNLMLLDDGALGFLDFGIIGRFDERTRRQVTDYVVAFATGDYRALGRALVSMDAVSSGVDLDAMARDLERAYAPILTTSFGELNYANVLPDILRASVKHRMRLPREFVLVTKQMLYFDRYAKLLAPKLNIFSDPRLVAAISEDVLRLRMTQQA
jgi:aarF domain-containing kinase